ncbi:MAG: AAA family ATPase [Polyangiales bacterium]
MSPQSVPPRPFDAARPSMLDPTPANSQDVAGLRIAGRYTLERLLGQGGMGAAYIAVDATTGKRVALKRLAAKRADKAQRLFEREYQTLASLRHPGIVEVYDYGLDEQGPFYTMELIDGRELTTLAPMPWREACACLRDVASILGLLHARKLVHRDLSPRNLLRLPDGRLKLIDFGALAGFGPSGETVGTPPFLAPEALRGEPLDQRSDLFSLGALGYWLMTGVHAYPARSLRELPPLWERAPSSLSSLVGLLKDERLEVPPPALDELIGALLRVQPSERPSNTTELIDRLHVLADLAPEAAEQAVEGYLNSKVFVGRTRERERIADALGALRNGTGTAFLVEGEAGIGRTRFLDELAITARLAGVLTLSIDDSVGKRPHACATALCELAFEVAPESSRLAATSVEPVLSRLSETLHRKLGGAVAASSGVPGEDRALAQSALRQFFFGLSQQRPLAILLDDLHAFDEESQGLFAALAHGLSDRRLLLVASAQRDESHETSPVLLSYRHASSRLHLLPLTSAETLEVLRSVFGGVMFLERFAEKLHRVAAGSPAYALELAEHAVRSGIARYQDGQWVLPADLGADAFPASRRAAHLERIALLSPAARELARVLSVPHHGLLSAADVEALQAQSSNALDELVRERVLVQAPAGYRFLHASVREALHAELDDSARRRAHLTLAESGLVSARNQDDKLRAALHFLRAGRTKRAHPLIVAAAESFTGAELNSALRVAAPLFEEIHELLVAQGADLNTRAEPLATLALAGYFIDRRYAARYGDEAVRVLETLLRLSLARKLARVLGSKLGLIIALVVAGVSLRLRSDRGPRLPMAIRLLLSVCSALAGTAACCIDPRRALALARVIEPLTVFGPDHAATIVHRFTVALSMVVQDQLALTNRTLRALIARLESDRPIKALDPGIRRNYLAGLHFSLGVNEAWHEGREVLRLADKIETYSPLYAMSADHLRENYHSRQGDVARAEEYRQRVELHAVQLGSAWQVETWAPAHYTETALRTGDAMVMKRGLQELGRLSQEIPSLEREEQHARGTYLMLRGKYEEAVPLLDPAFEPLGFVGYTRTCGSLARCHNGLGQHDKAKEICSETIALLTPEDLAYPVMNLSIQIELAHAHAGLGERDAAWAVLDGLLVQFGDCEDPLTLGLIHQACFRVALGERDLARAHRHLDALELHYRPLGIASLLQLLNTAKRDLERIESPEVVVQGPAPRLLDDVSHLMTRVQLVLNHGATDLVSERGNKALQVALELTSADEGFLVLQGARAGGEIYLGMQPSREVLGWAKQQLHAATLDDQTVMTDAVDTESDSNYLVVGRTRYCAATLSGRRGAQDVVVGTLVLAFDGRVPRMPDGRVLGLIAHHLMD